VVFSSLLFLFVFLPTVLGFYYLAPQRFRNAVLLIFSYVFYLWGAGEFLALLVLSTLVDYALGLLIARSPKGRARLVVAASVGFNLSLLAYFKYSNFFVAKVNLALAVLDVGGLPWSQVVLPLGISFFTFHKITYIVDVYRGTKKAFVNVVDFALYLALFPQLIAGPIVRFHEIADQLQARTETAEKFQRGALRFCWGLAKKVLVANSCGEIADAAFGVAPGELGTAGAWLGVAAYTAQIYFDFSGYTDMALGLGLMFGFTLPENFNRPYSAVSITDFWRRWHMSLTRFFRDYVYIPLGGNRQGDARTYFNLMLVFVLCGFWHGAAWTFLAWGIYHGFWLIVERMTGFGRAEATTNVFFRRSLTLAIVMVGWVFFRATNLTHAISFLGTMFVPNNLPLPLTVGLALNGRNLSMLAMAALVVFLPRHWSGARLITAPAATPALSVARVAAVALFMFYAVGTLASTTYNPFLYFRF
jgi:alginate O-acetyltransferase complex protein AlgI